MGNKSSSTSKAQYSSNSQGEKVASTQLQYVAAPHPRKISTNNPKDVSQTQQHGKKPLGNDEAFTTYIKDARVKMKSKSNIGVHHEDVTLGYRFYINCFHPHFPLKGYSTSINKLVKPPQ